MLRASGFSKDLVIQHLDDICAAAPANMLELLNKFDKTFFKVAAELGITLAPRDNPLKSFKPSQQGIVLGVYYDLKNWTWGIPEDKLLRLRINLKEAITSVSITQADMWSLCGKILHVKDLIPSGKFQLDYILRANSESTDRAHRVIMNEQLLRQLTYWFYVLPLCSGQVRIPDPFPHIAPWAVNVYCDAAGGSKNSPWHGVGTVADSWWAYAPWGHRINTGKDAGRGRSLDRVLSALELLGPVLTLAAGFQWAKGRHVRIWVDNAAAVHIYRKGYSTSCPLSSTLVKALDWLAAALSCKVDIVKISRCSNTPSLMADALSKGHFWRFHQLAAADNLSMAADKAWVPTALMKWIVNPQDDDRLGQKILHELAPLTSLWGTS